MLEVKTNYGGIFRNIVQTTSNYLKENKGLESLVIGLSGGIDSTLSAALAFEILKEVPTVRLIGRVIPIETNSPDETARGRRAGRIFCHQFETVNLTTAHRDLLTQFVSGSTREGDQSTAEKIRRGNLKARVRMAYLFDLAHFENGMVLSTDNYTELLLGFWTLHGDVGNYGMIQNLWKTEVYGLSQYLADKYRQQGEEEKAQSLEQCIRAVPTDGLGITTSDFEQIGVTDYTTADKILIAYLKGSTAYDDHLIIKKHRQTNYKRLDPQNISRNTLLRT
jgi:NAD+ synthase